MVAGWKEQLAIKATEIAETERQIKAANEKEQIELQKVNSELRVKNKIEG